MSAHQREKLYNVMIKGTLISGGLLTIVWCIFLGWLAFTFIEAQISSNAIPIREESHRMHARVVLIANKRTISLEVNPAEHCRTMPVCVLL